MAKNVRSSRHSARAAYSALNVRWFGARRAPSVFAPDALSPEALRAALLGVCASRRWADLVAAAAPYHSLAGLQRAADVALGALDETLTDLSARLA